MAGINHVTGEWWWIPGTRGLKRGCPMKDGKIDNRAGRDDVTTDKLFPNRGECLGLYRCVLIIFKRK